MIKAQMPTGLYDKDVQQEVLAKDKGMTTFQHAQRTPMWEHTLGGPLSIDGSTSRPW